jgi:hypothetical protein
LDESPSLTNLQIGPIQKPASETTKDRNRRKKTRPVAESASNEAIKPSPNDQEDEWEVEESLKVTGPSELDALGITRDTADEDILRAVVIGPSQPVRGGIVSGAKPAKRQASRMGGKKRANNATAIAFGPEAQLVSKWLSSAQVKQLEKDTGTCQMS